MSAKGSVLMEYVVLTCLVSIVLLEFFQNAKFDKRTGEPISGFYNTGQGYIGLGAKWADHVRLLHRAIALPVP